MTETAMQDNASTETATKGKKAAPVITTVKMDDGRVVDFVGKRRIQREAFVVDGKVQIRLDFVNGETRLFTIPDNLMLKFASHGAIQKLGDEAAGIADMDDTILAIDNLMDRLAAGEWDVQRDKSELAGASILLKALAEQTGKSVADIKVFLKDKTPAQKLALRANAKIKPIVDRLEAEKAAKSDKKAEKIDSDALLGEFLGEPGDTTSTEA